MTYPLATPSSIEFDPALIAVQNLGREVSRLQAQKDAALAVLDLTDHIPIMVAGEPCPCVICRVRTALADPPRTEVPA